MTETALRDKAIIAGLLDSYWAMEPQILARMTEVILRHAQGVKLDAGEIDAIVAARSDGGDTPAQVWRSGSTAIVPITGVLVKHSYLVNGESQPRGTAMLQARQRLEAATEDAATDRTLLLFDTPGGSVFGIADMAEAIRQADARKPVYAMIEDIGASGGYWLASQARRLYVNSTAMVGSIGVYTVLVDASRRADQMGLRFDLVKAGAHKGIGVSGTAITEGDRQIVQQEVDALYEHFIAAVASGRKMNPDAVRSLADGRVHIGRAAVDLGLADEVSTLDALLASLERQNNARGSGGPARGAASTPTRVAAGDRESKMDNKKEATPPQTPAADADAIRRAAVEEANAAAAQRVKDLTAALGGRTELLTRAIADGLDVTTAKAELADVLTAENKALAEQLAEANGKIQEISGELQTVKDLVAKSGIKPLNVTGGAEGGDASGGDDGGYAAKVAELMEAGKSEHRARLDASKKFPEAHKAWLKTQQPE